MHASAFLSAFVTVRSPGIYTFLDLDAFLVTARVGVGAMPHWPLARELCRGWSGICLALFYSLLT